jgi:DNA polymerase-3 subunit delta'
MSVDKLEEKEKTVKCFRNLLHSDRLPHSLLLYGGDIEKLEYAAKYLAKILNCEKPSIDENVETGVESCGSCSSCSRIQDETHPDVYWIRPESKLRQITVDSIRELIREIQLKPLEGKWKVAVIVAADRMHHNAANAFLKTLEEPPPRSLIILISTEPHRLLGTIVSRCQKIIINESDIPKIDQFKDFYKSLPR